MDTKENIRANIKAAIQSLDGSSQAARILGLKGHQVIQQWIATGSVPAEWCPKIEQATGGATRCEDIRPSVDWGWVRSTGPIQTSPKSAKTDGQRSPPPR